MAAPPPAETVSVESPDDCFGPGFASVRSQALFRHTNEEIRRIADGFAVDDDLELVCECGHGDCFARVCVSSDDYEAVRRFPTRFLMKGGHVGDDERIVQETAGYAVVEKVGRSAAAAILLHPRRELDREEAR
jgi:hypothetical protein